jgi:hypothetical protein
MPDDDHPKTDAQNDDEYGEVPTGADAVREPEPVPADDDQEPAKQGD